MIDNVGRRDFMRWSAATTFALAAGPSRWGWAEAGSPFAQLQDDPLIKLPEGFSYRIVAETGMPMTGGRGPFGRPEFPDLNVAFPLSDERVLVSTSHEVSEFFPFPHPPPGEEYDRMAGGAITSLILDRDFSVLETAYNAGGMINNCSGAGTPWGTVLTGEEATATLEADHGFVWEVDPVKHTKVRLDACGRFEHETAVVDRKTGFVYLTEDSGEALLYRMRPREPGALGKGGMLEAYARNGRWVPIPDPVGANGKSPAEQGKSRGALVFQRLEGGRFDGRWFYFTETEDETACGKVWRVNVDSGRLHLWAEGNERSLCMPDNVVFDAARNVYVCEDKSSGPNRIIFIDRDTGELATFAELTHPEDEPTGPVFVPGRRALLLNLQRSGNFGVTIVINGPFARRPKRSGTLPPAAPPRAASPAEAEVLRESSSWPSVSLLSAAALLNLRRRGRIDELTPDLEDAASQLHARTPVVEPKRRLPKIH